MVIAGRFFGTVDFRGGTLYSAGQDDIYVAKFNADGEYLWSRSFGSTLSDRGDGAALDASGNTFVTGRFRGSIDFGGGTLTDAGTGDIFIAKLAP